MFCTKCGNSIPDGSTFCTSCGAPVDDAAPEVNGAAAVPEQPQQEQPKENPIADAAAKVEDAAAKAGAAVSAAAAGVVTKAKKLDKKWFIIGAAALVVIILAIILIASLGGGGGTSPLLYRKSDELFAYGLKGDPFMISDDYDSYGSLTVDESNLFYTDSGEYSSSGYTLYRLYYRDVNNAESKLKDADPEKGLLVSKDVYSFRTSGKTVVYLKDMSDSGGKLRYNDLKHDEVSIDSDVKSFRLSGDGKKVVYLKDKDGELTLYEVNLSKPDEKTKIASDVYTILGVDTETYNTYCFLKSNDDSTYNLYLVEKGTATKLLSDVDDWTWGGKDNQELYFSVAEETEYDLKDLVNDDMDDDDYDAEYIREEAAEDPYVVYSYTIYKLDGSETVEVAKDVSYFEIGQEYIVYTGTDFDIEKPDLSDLIDDGYYYWWGIAQYVLYGEDYSGGALYAKPFGGEAYEIFTGEDMEDIAGLRFDGDNSILYILDDYDEDDECGTLNSVQLGSKKAGEKVKIADDVGDLWLEDGTLFYLQDMDSNGEGTAYSWNGKKAVKVGDDVWELDSYSSGEKDTIIVVWSDYSDGEATLNVWNGKTLIKVADDVLYDDVSYKGNNRLFYLQDYNFSKARGDLMQWTGKDSTKIDEDVSEILR